MTNETTQAFSPEAIESASREVKRLQSELDITNADHIALWIEANLIPDEPMSQCVSWFACRIAEAYERTIARPSLEPRRPEDRDQQVRRIMNANAEYMNGVDRGQVRFGYAAVVCMIEAAIVETEARHRLAHSLPSQASDAGCWRPMDSAPRDGTRVNLCWNDCLDLSPHVELGKWKASAGWCNTYGKPFHGDPDMWMPLPPPPSLATLTAPPTSGEEMRLREALAGFGDDFMTSEQHHPGYVLIPSEQFERIRAALTEGAE